MIIKSSRLPTREGARGTADHVLRGEANEEITLVHGSEQDLHDFVADARAARKPYSIRHWKLSPEQDITPAQEAEAVALVAQEFGFDPERVVVVRHRKRRSRRTASEYHLHLLVPEYDPVRRRVLATRWDRARHEKLSRLLEVAWGHAVVPGRFNAPVIAALSAEGRAVEAALLSLDLDGDDRPEATHPQHQVQELARRSSWTAGRITEAVRDARAMAATSEEFRALLAEQGLRIAEGAKGGRWIVEAPTGDGGWLHGGAVHRLLKADLRGTDEWMRGLADRPAIKGRKGHEQDRAAVEADGFRGGQGGDARSRRPARAGSQRDADGVRGGPGRGNHGGPDHGLGGPGARGRRGQRPDQDRGAAPGAGGAPAHAERADPRARRIALLAREAGIRDGARHDGGRAIAALGAVSTAAAGQGQDQGRARGLNHLLDEVRVLLDEVRVQWRFGERERLDWLHAQARAVRADPSPLPGEENRGIAEALTEAQRRKKRARFHAVLLKKAYSIRDWLPPEALLHLRRVDIHPDTGRVLISLWPSMPGGDGARILDTGDRIVLRGEVEDVGAAEVAECAVRRGWGKVEVTGTEEFRREVTRELLKRGIEVEGYPLHRGGWVAMPSESARLSFTR